MSSCYELALKFKKKYPTTIALRISKHCKIIDKHLNPDEKIIYVFVGQKNEGTFDFVNSYVIALTNKRIMLASKRLLWGYYFKSVTPELYNDLTVTKSIIWGKIVIDTIKETIILSDISASALPEIETQITTFMMKEKKKYPLREKAKED